jgi:HJR/Mrr/RecB family endonuclease
VTPQAGDFGADVITVKDKTKTVIQAKCFGEGQSVGVEAINEVCGGAGYWNAQNKVVFYESILYKIRNSIC